MLIDRKQGSFFFIGTVLTDLPLETDKPFEADHCGSCTACIDACPTDALVAERLLDSRRCISYLTIEAREEPPPELARKMSNLVFGCDICQEVCPWNISFAQPVGDDVLEQRPELGRVELASFENMSDAEFEERFGWTPLERPGLEGMRRNTRIAKRNENGVGR
jgi:epoxyqueuosine reductase